jgi:hypothetical protein
MSVIGRLFARKPRKPVGSSSRSGGYFTLHLKKSGKTYILKNLVPTVSLNYQNDVMTGNTSFGGIPACGLIGGSPSFSPSDTMASHAGWTEITNYDEAARPAWDALASSGGVTTSDTPAEFTMDGDTDVAGAFLCTDNTKGGTTGILFAEAAADGAPITVPDNEVAQLTYTYTHTSG